MSPHLLDAFFDELEKIAALPSLVGSVSQRLATLRKAYPTIGPKVTTEFKALGPITHATLKPPPIPAVAMR